MDVDRRSDAARRGVSLAPSDAIDDLATELAGVARALWSAPTVQDTLQRIVDFSLATIDGCDGAGIWVLHDGAVSTPVSTGPEVLEVDGIQQVTCEGPCVDALAADEMAFYAEDLAVDPRWPRFGPLAAARGMRSLLSFQLSTDTTLGALNLYAHLPRAYGATDRAKGLIFAAYAGLALGAAQAIEGAAKALAVENRRLQDLEGALASRQVIGRAEGVLMQRELITADQAFSLLRRASPHLNIKLREVAQRVVDTGEVPTGP